MSLDLNAIQFTKSSIPATLPLQDLEFVGFYFAAHWCPPARNFMSKLLPAYNIINQGRLRFEIIFVSFDRDEDSFESYSEVMPWLLVSFKDTELKMKLVQHFKVDFPFKLIICDSALKVVSLDGIDQIKSKGTQCLDFWMSESSRLSESRSQNMCEQSHTMSLIVASSNDKCIYCKFEIVKGWKCVECAIDVCQICQEFSVSSDFEEDAKLLCLKSHRLKRNQKMNEYYLKRFLTEKYTCRSCNAVKPEVELHCFPCIFDVCQNCTQAIKHGSYKKPCKCGRSIEWTHDISTKNSIKYKNCGFRCDVCSESYIGGGGFSCQSCEFYVCLGCIHQGR